jgi:hypothetical protein
VTCSSYQTSKRETLADGKKLRPAETKGKLLKIGETQRFKTRERNEMSVKHQRKKPTEKENRRFRNTHNMNVIRVVVGSIVKRIQQLAIR